MLWALVAVSLALVAADDGVWRVRNTQGVPPGSGYWGARAATGNGFMWVLGGDNSNNATQQYNWATNTWSQIGLLPLYTNSLIGPDVVWAGGNLYLVGGLTHTGAVISNIWVLSTPSGSPTRNGWNPVPTPSVAPAARVGHTLTQLNGYLFLIGGWTGTTYFGSVWAFDLTQLSEPTNNNWLNANWIPVVSDSSPTTPFPARGMHTTVQYEDHLVLFGGFSHNPSVPYSKPDDCNKAGANCAFYNDLWFWTPGQPPTATPWMQFTVWNGVQPSGRYGHTAGMVNGETMVVFGGVGKSGPLNDLWAFDLATVQMWRQLKPLGSGPPAGPAHPLGGSMGRHFLVYNSEQPTTLYVYYPVDPSSVTPTPGPEVCESLDGVHAGFGIAIVVCIATLVFGVWNWKLLKPASA